ncbi:hypothetical protein UM654_05780 [Staphylococcus aureus]|nr:hypothetical protein UM654_05780 [Staphylococcus aureus]
MWATPLYKPDYFRTYLQPNTEYTISYEIQIDNFNGAKTLTGRSFGMLLYDYTDTKVLSNFSVETLPETVDPKLVGKKFKATKTFTTPSSFKNNLNFLAYAGYYLANDRSRIYPSVTISNLKLETGNIVSDWTPAQKTLLLLYKITILVFLQQKLLSKRIKIRFLKLLLKLMLTLCLAK